MHIERISQVHPGRVLLEEFLAPQGISQVRFAGIIQVSPRRIYEIVQGQRSIMPISLTASRIISACRSATGSICRHGTISSPKRCVCKDRVDQSD
jgi:hypothetical protein